MSLDINLPTEVIARAHKRWKRNRDMVAGEDAVKAAGIAYLPAINGMTPEEYQNYNDRVPFFPGASRTHDGLVGLITRKRATVEAPDGVAKLFVTITRSGHDLDDLAEEVLSETMVTGFLGMLIDHPTASGAANLRDAEAMGARPFIAPYMASSILEVTPGVWNNRQTLVRVRLLDDPETVRELVLDQGVYRIIIHRLIGDQWTASAPITPLRKGKPLDEIPFVLCTPKARAFSPVKGPLDDVCSLNVHLFHAQADAHNSRYYSSAPILTLINVPKPEGGLSIHPGTVLFAQDSTKEKPVEIKFVEFSGHGQETLENAVGTIKDEMAKLGSNILASERTAAEAAETHQIRRSSENSVLAGIARAVSRKIEDALNWVSWWAGEDDDTLIKFALNTDFVPARMSSEDRKALLAELQAGAISQETFWSLMVEGEILPEDFDMDEERQRIAADTALVDRPTGDPVEQDDQPAEGE
ncbi:DUF4055 domain-containing protein [Brevundimonas sp. NPDC058933]|uniref:DUF4055 domain-containing protein n=1 Tax=Brevundimonas sp. NPDC058933 TaxID=3346673 RepID=UPI003BEF2304